VVGLELGATITCQSLSIPVSWWRACAPSATQPLPEPQRVVARAEASPSGAEFSSRTASAKASPSLTGGIRVLEVRAPGRRGRVARTATRQVLVA
jgi:hypothetical protein